MTNPEADRIERYQYFQRQTKNNMRWFNFSAGALPLCLAVAFFEGSGAGWPWLLGALMFLFVGLWSLIEARYFEVKIMLHILPADLKRISPG